MADRLDVAGRLAEGRSAVEHTQTYVRASQVVGYRHPELTAHPTQIHDWYDSEDGLDLHALDADCARLRAADAMLTEALREQRAQVTALATAWTGPGADAAVAFMQRHCDTAGALITEIRAAAQRCESLRDNLWQLVDAKVATAVAIDDRTLAQRRAWLAAAAAVTGGESAAQQVITQQVVPYVDTVIGKDWVAAMRSTRAAVTACFDLVTDRLATAMPAHFEVPGDFGPSSSPPSRPQRPVAHSAQPATVLTAPASVEPARGPGYAAPASAPTQSASPPNPIPAQPDSIPPLGVGGAGLGSGGGLGGDAGLGRLGGLASRIIQEMGGLLGGEPPDPEHRFDDEEDHSGSDADHKHTKDKTDAPEAPEPGKQTLGEATANPPVGEPAPMAQPSQPLPTAEPAPAYSPPNAPPPKAPTSGSTPCEIAANELPQAGQ